MNKHILLSSIIISGIYIPSLSAMLMKRILLAPKQASFSHVMKNKRSITTEVDIPKLTQETNQTYLHRYPHLNLLPHDSILRKACEEEARLTHNSICHMNRFFTEEDSPERPARRNGSRLLWNLEDRLESARNDKIPVQIKDILNSHMMHRAFCITFLASITLCASSPFMVLVIGQSAAVGALLGAPILYNKLGSNRSILRKLFKNSPRKIQKNSFLECYRLLEHYYLPNTILREFGKKEIQKKALIEYYQLSDTLVNEYQKKQKKENKAD